VANGLTPECLAQIERTALKGHPSSRQRTDVLELIARVRELESERADLLAMAVAARGDLHTALCEGAFRVDRDPMAINGILLGVQAWRYSTGQARTCLRRWLAGLPIEAPDCVPVQRVDGVDICDVCQQLADPVAGCTCTLYLRGREVRRG
jgi:hypothetical protein